MFEMNDRGLAEVPNPSLVMLSGRPLNVSGICVACTMEGSRPLLAEVQGLVSPTAFGNPRRMSTGFDTNRLMLLTAVLVHRVRFWYELYYSPPLYWKRQDQLLLLLCLIPLGYLLWRLISLIVFGR